MVESFCPLHIPKIVNNCKLNGSYFLKNITKYTIVDRNGHRLGLFILFCDTLTANHTRSVLVYVVFVTDYEHVHE